MNFLFYTGIGFLLVAPALNAQEAPKKDFKLEGGLEFMKKLKGDWTQKGTDKVLVRYQVTAGGSAVLETMFLGTPQEMVTLYHRDGKTLKMTHYCMMGNQPTMRSAGIEKGNSILWTCESVSNSASHDDPHMHRARLTLDKEGVLHSDWTLAKNGKDARTHRFVLGRKK